jgi:hypothetical protein
LLGFAEIPTIPVTHLDEAQKKAFAIADNQLGTISKWDDPVLAEQLRELSLINLDFDLEVTGFEVAEIDLRIESLNLDVDESDPADTLPAVATGEPVSRLGDVWTLGRHRLLCGDALDPAAYTTLMRGKKADMVFTDPPYNVKIDGHATGLGVNRHREFAMAASRLKIRCWTEAIFQNPFPGWKVFSTIGTRSLLRTGHTGLPRIELLCRRFSRTAPVANGGFFFGSRRRKMHVKRDLGRVTMFPRFSPERFLP